PLFRMAEIYLNLAEAYNETNKPADALKYLNAVHNRAGLPSITETDQNNLREIIKREKAIEFFNENQRYFDVKHWKDPRIGTEIIGGPKRELVFHVTSNSGEASVIKGYWDTVRYETYWHPRMYLEPFPLQEVNKGIIVQNPGY
ncbi:MAG TPA: RagB/SusD family nutrient uptake outer membrane protein, partial [Candidatus Cryptobacteroides intestinipullorum]|nr:RagB/SusD family nutrient uptake outer membrane protein [Candidatus Cryptobacteroides intestinipullorum]